MIQRKQAVPRLIEYFIRDYIKAMRKYEIQAQIEFTNYLLYVFILHIAGDEKNEAESIFKRLELLRKIHGKKFKPFEKANLETYLKFDRVLLEKKIYTPAKFLKLYRKQLSPRERIEFLKQIKDYLNRSDNDLKHKLKVQPPLVRDNTKSKIRRVYRQSTDALTCLDKQQTVLFIHYLQKGDAILPEEFLHNVKAGEAFEILTGYNWRMMSTYSYSKFLNRYKNKKNLKKLSQLFSRLKKEVDSELKTK